MQLLAYLPSIGLIAVKGLISVIYLEKALVLGVSKLEVTAGLHICRAKGERFMMKAADLLPVF